MLQEFHETWGPKGLSVMVAIFEDAQFNPATPQIAKDWKDRFGLSFPLVVDAEPFKLGEYYNKDLTPMNMFVDVETMRILSVSTGFDRQLAESVVEGWL